MTTTLQRDLATTALDALQRAYGPQADLGPQDLSFITEVLVGRWRDADQVGEGLARSVWIATVVLRARGAGPTFVIVPSEDEAQFHKTHREPLERLGLRFGTDVIVHGVLDVGPVECADGELLQTTGALLDGHLIEPGLVALLGHSEDGFPGSCHPDIDEWLRSLSHTTPVARCWELTPRPIAKAADRQEPDSTFDVGALFGFDLADDPLADAEAGPARPDPASPFIWPAERIRRPGLSQEIAAQLRRPHPPIVAITGRPGSGRTSLLAEVAATLRDSGEAPRLRRFRPTTAEPERDLARELERCPWRNESDGSIIVIDDLDVLARLATKAPNLELLGAIKQTARKPSAHLVLIVDERRFELLEEWDRELFDLLCAIPLGDLPQDDLVEVVDAVASQLTEDCGLRIDDDVTAAALAPAGPSDTLAHPGLAIDRIEAAIGRVRTRHETTVRVEHLKLPTGHVHPTTATRLRQRLHAVVRGQDQALTTISHRLAPALAGLKLRPERPLGVFLFAGPTGVGKTETAKQLAQAVYGSPEAIIRLDMSEYADQQDARMKLIGGHRVWKNSSTEGLLTTRVRENPRSVVLLDEFEKSHPSIWPMFLQVFDEGRLTDGWSNTASFAETIIIMTSNLGVREANKRAAGFGTIEGFDAAKQLEAIAKKLPPEFLNRLTETVAFDPLSEAAIHELASMELGRAAARFAANGWRIEHDADVVDYLAETGYDPACGARHLQRNIERELLPLLADAPSRRVRVTRGGQGLLVTPFDKEQQ